MEQYAKGEAELWDLPQMYEWQFDTAVPEKFPHNKYVDLRDSYYSQGLNFLKSFEGYEDLNILGVEEEFTINIDDWQFNGFIDLVFKDKDGRLIIRDYKSKASFKNDNEKHKYARQLYLYSLYAKEKYGRYPDELQFLMFRKQREPVRIPFNIEDLEEAVQWAKDTVAIIRNAFDYPAQCDDFYGENLCNHREYCPLKPPSKFKKKKR
jgi:RecB family exonuclease